MENNKSSTSKPPTPSTPQSVASDPKAPAARPLYSSKLSDGKDRSTDNVNSRQAPVPQQKARSSAKNPITGRSNSPQQNNPNNNNQPRQSPTASLREGQRVYITLTNGHEYEGIYAVNPTNSATFSLRMVQQKKGSGSGDSANGTGKRDQASMSFQKKDVADARVTGSNNSRGEGRTQNGNRAGFRTDTAISNGRLGSERVLQPWVPDAADEVDGSLEKSSGSSKGWDQFAANEHLFGIKTDYDENIYTTIIDKSHPQYQQRMLAADRKAREIERSTPTTAHVAEERIMDFAGGDDQGGDEEDKYSGVRRGEFASLTSGKENRYTPPARRAPTGQATVKGAPVDPAIISSQIKGSQSKKPSTPVTEESKPSTSPQPSATASADPSASGAANKSDSKAEAKAKDGKNEEKAAESKNVEKSSSTLRATATTARTVSPQAKDGAAAPSATSTVEADVLKSFKTFATQQRAQADKVRTNKMKADNQVKLQELKKFADSFKLATPVPKDLISIIAKDPAKQKQIQAKALQNAEDVKRAKDAAKEKDSGAAKDTQAKPTVEQPPAQSSAAPPADNRNARSGGPQHTPSPSAMNNNRHPGPRQSYGPQGYHQPFRGDRQPTQHMASRQTGNLGERLRKVEQERARGGQQHYPNSHEMRIPPTGPANSVDPNYGRRLSAMAPPHPHLAAKLNPNSHEFKPNPYATSFSPNGPSTGSSPRSGVNVVEPQPVSAPQSGQLIRRKTKSIDVAKCFILAHIKTAHPPQGRNWDDNNGLRPSYDTLPTWRQLQDNEKADSTMHLTYKEYFERLPFGGPALTTPNPSHAMPQVPHQHQLPFHLQHGAHGMPRQSPHMAPMPMHPQPGPTPQMPYNNGDDHRMMQSNSAQSFASPRMAQMSMYPPQMNSPAQMPPYNQAVAMPQFIPSTPQMNQFRSFSNSPQYMAQQPGPMGMQVMPPQFMTGPSNMVPSSSQMGMYPGQPQFINPGGAPPQPMPGSNGYPSPGRPAAAPMMMQQGSQQGQHVYGMSPGMPYQQPVYTGQAPNQIPMRGFSNSGPQHFGTSPQQMHQFGHRNGSHSYGNKNFHGHNQHQPAQGGHAATAGPSGRAGEGPEEAK